MNQRCYTGVHFTAGQTSEFRGRDILAVSPGPMVLSV